MKVFLVCQYADGRPVMSEHSSKGLATKAVARRQRRGHQILGYCIFAPGEIAVRYDTTKVGMASAVPFSKVERRRETRREAKSQQGLLGGV